MHAGEDLGTEEGFLPYPFESHTIFLKPHPFNGRGKGNLT